MRILPGRGRRAPSQTIVLLARVFLLAVLLPIGVAADDAPLHVLLTNDDGYDAPGIKAMHRALLGGGYRVSVVAPRDQQSGSSMRVSIGSIRVEQLEKDFWTVAGTPADSVSFALLKLLRDSPPDVVVSGANFGQNLGSNTNISGTVGAAIMAAQLGVPAIAVSVGIHLDEREATPVRFPSTMDAFAPTAAFTVKLLREIDRTRQPGTQLLPANKLLNLNYPALRATEVKGMRVARVARTGGFVPVFVETDTPGKIRIALEHGNPIDRSQPAADTKLFAEGYITVSVLDGSLDDGRENSVALEERLADLLVRERTDRTQ